MKILVTGSAGFIGFHTSKQLLERGDTVIGLDNLNDYYDVRLKTARLEILKQSSSFIFEQIDLSDREAIASLFSNNHFDAVIHLAAQAGVRYSIDNPLVYTSTNVVGFAHILEGCRHQEVNHLVYASSSSVYGANTKLPFSEHHNVDHPISLYAATKKANELMAHTYSHLYRIPTTGLRFFTVYGPWGRPDMALFKFTDGILNDRPIPVFNHGKMVRDFTYIDDIVEGVIRVTDQPAAPSEHWSSDQPDPSSSNAPYRIFNIGNNRPIELMRYIQVLEDCLGKKAKIEYLPIQDGDVPSTTADVSALEEAVGYRPSTDISVGIANFVEWYRSYYCA